jgi:hypothetical protein
MTTKTKKKQPKMYNIQLYYKQGADLASYLEEFEKEGVPSAILRWLEQLEINIKSIKKLVKQLDKKNIKCLADTNDIALVTSDPKTIKLLEENESHLVHEDVITVDVSYLGTDIDSKLDEKLSTLAKQYHGKNIAAGYFFGEGGKNGCRDMTFEFEFLDEAEEFGKAATKLIPKKQRVG